ncbi:rhomboid family intramembrane serine protease [Streptococcus azizii]|uniref:Rhomboid family intramembrane serine protease n=1 Tax=Streptococcus azizii TaxID=1579424 RepID=A0AB36JNX1_9STRE|nr:MULTISPECIES: rhomboid family intramembrane serine protease [Streptococcus]MBF0776081.1 rhomboid family intramembrane serine protease [Streptococcus sp. 19428wD3_AN2]ONK28905.1 rhomboid family intramembrane serine protease [Streptococcus azizii]ONK30416.1 rhomboid family intramembrane serine protease [Streptococcus azizii]ONK31104.1 rhomboid family intramembrane serine protease [Streptococcus azizii]TFU83645.1 rhomboid family intramembrane serine protease [Streptococcus sp. AN2]
MNKAINTRYPVTNVLLLVTALVFIVMQVVRFGEATTAQTIYDFGGLYGLAVKLDPSQLWRLVSPMFVHIGWEHFFFNSMTLYVFGYQLEAIFGSRHFLLLYVLSGIMGNVFVLFLTPNVVAAGASTSLFGLFGAMVVLRYHSRNPYLQSLGQRYVALLLINLALGLFRPEISLVGHIGGVVGGALASVFLPIREEQELFTSRQQRLALLLYVVLTVGLIVSALV